MSSPELMFTIFYALFAMCLITPPTEFISAGLTVQNLLGSYLGSEDLNFVYYHLKRTCATLLFHSLIPLGYLLGYSLMTTNANFSLLAPATLHLGWQYFLLVSLALPFLAAIQAYWWYRKNWSHHPITKQLRVYTPQGSTWKSVASSINVEFRRIDKFMTGPPGRRIFVTDSWVIKTSVYNVYVAQQNDIHLSLEDAEHHELSHEASTGVQYLRIAVNNIHANVQPFHIRLLASEYQDLRDKLSAPVRNARNIVIQQSLSDRFIQAFREEVEQNPMYRKPDDVEIENCIGCMQTPANVKLQKLCDDPASRCVQCFCRPMWCLECMARWFSSRQDQTAPETWMSSTSPCPTCRAVFCMADVCKIS